MWMRGQRRREEQRGKRGHRVRWAERTQTPRSQRLGSARPKLGTLSKSIPGASNSWTLGMERTILMAAPQCRHTQRQEPTGGGVLPQFPQSPKSFRNHPKAATDPALAPSLRTTWPHTEEAAWQPLTSRPPVCTETPPGALSRQYSPILPPMRHPPAVSLSSPKCSFPPSRLEKPLLLLGPRSSPSPEAPVFLHP